MFRALHYFENNLFLELPTEFLFLFLVSLSCLICIFLSPADREVAGSLGVQETETESYMGESYPQ